MVFYDGTKNEHQSECISHALISLCLSVSFSIFMNAHKESHVTPRKESVSIKPNEKLIRLKNVPRHSALGIPVSKT